MKIEITKPVTRVLHIASGLPGKSAYQVAVDEGETRPVNEWLAGLEGASVITGEGPPVDPGRKIDQPYINALTGDVYGWTGDGWEFRGNIASVVPGPANTLAIGTVVEGPVADAVISGTAPNQTLSLMLPQATPGPPNTLAIGTVVEGPTAGATITGTSPSQTLNLVLPEADPGPQGPTGDAGPAINLGNMSGAIDLSSHTFSAQWFGITATGNLTLAAANMPTLPAGIAGTISLSIKQDGIGSRTLVTSGIQWAEGVAPILPTEPNAKAVWHFSRDGFGDWIGWVGARKVATP